MIILQWQHIWGVFFLPTYCPLSSRPDCVCHPHELVLVHLYNRNLRDLWPRFIFTVPTLVIIVCDTWTATYNSMPQQMELEHVASIWVSFKASNSFSWILRQKATRYKTLIDCWDIPLTHVAQHLFQRRRRHPPYYTILRHISGKAECQASGLSMKLDHILPKEACCPVSQMDEPTTELEHL